MSFNPLSVDVREQEYLRMQEAKKERERKHAIVAGIQDKINHSRDWDEIRRLENIKAMYLH